MWLPSVHVLRLPLVETQLGVGNVCLTLSCLALQPLPYTPFLLT